MDDRPSRRLTRDDFATDCPPECRRLWEEQRRRNDLAISTERSLVSKVAAHDAQLDSGVRSFSRLQSEIDARGMAAIGEARSVRTDHDHELQDVRSRLEKEAEKVRERVEAAERAHVPKPTPWLAIISVSSVLILALCGALWNLAVRVQERPTMAQIDAMLAPIQADIAAMHKDLAVVSTDTAIIKATWRAPVVVP